MIRRDLPDGGPNFLGPYAQGAPGRRILYLNWGKPICATVGADHITWKIF